MGCCNFQIGINPNQYSSVSFAGSNCPDKFGCPPNKCPDFTIKRHDIRPHMRVAVNDCDGPLDLSEPNLVLEVNMWATAKLKTAITTTDTYFPLANNIGFEQVIVGDVIIMDRTRLPEQMLVIGINEENYLIEVQRGYHGSQISSWKKGNKLRIFRVLNGIGSIEMIAQDCENEDGSVDPDKLSQTNLLYEWQPDDTCLPGCYWLEFKLLKMTAPTTLSHSHTVIADDCEQNDLSWAYKVDDPTIEQYSPLEYINAAYIGDPNLLAYGNTNIDFPSCISICDSDDILPLTCDDKWSTNTCVTTNTCSISTVSTISVCSGISFSSTTPYGYDCSMGIGVEWVRRFPTSEAFLVKISDSPTSDM